MQELLRSKDIEIWRNIEGVDGYLVSSKGQVKSLNYKRTGKEKVLKQTKNNGYMIVNLRGEVWLVHRLVAMAFVPNYDGKLEVGHINNDTCDNRAENLEWTGKRLQERT